VVTGTIVAITSITWLAGVATVTTTTPHGLAVGTVMIFNQIGFTPAGYNGTVQGTVTTTTAYTYPLAVNPGAVTTAGSCSFLNLAATAVPNPGLAEYSLEQSKATADHPAEHPAEHPVGHPDHAANHKKK
jgi:hypothetical protein